MIQKTTTLSKGYQITLPSALRKAFNLQAGDEIEVIERKDGILLKRAESREERIKRWFANMEKERAEDLRKMTPEQRKFAKMSAGWTINQYHEYFDNLPETKAYIKEKYGV